VVSRRVGILGGTFDPPHLGHLLLAEGAREAMSLERVLFVPAKAPPHKLDEPHTPASYRLRMLELAIADNPAFSISRLDIDRPGPHYSADMVELVREGIDPAVELYFLMGMDSLTNILTWHEPARLLHHCRLIVAGRPGYSVDLSHIAEQLPEIEGRLHWISIPLSDISASDIRRRLRSGRSIRYQVPDSVRCYIDTEGLYRD